MAVTSGSGVYVPPKPPKPPVASQAQALAEHIALMSGQTPAQVTGYPDAVDPGISPQAQLASYAGPMPAYGQAPVLINQYLRAEGSPLAGLGKVITKKSRKWGIDPRLLVAIAGAETSLGKDPNAAPLSEHNVWGMGPGIEYGSWGEGANAVAKNLAQNYFSQGLDTIPEISTKWAPVGAANDPNGVNKNWTGNVQTYYKALSKVVGKEAAMKLFPVLGNVKWQSLGGVSAHMSRPLGNWQSDNAIDMGAPVGTPVYAPAGGRLVGGFGPSDNGATVYGSRLTLDPRAPGLPEWFMTHLSGYAPGIEEGSRVHRGDVLGYIGARDAAWTPHLHFGQEFGDPEKTVTENLYSPSSSVPAYRGSSWSRPSTPQDVAAQDAQAQNVANTAGAINAAAFGDAPVFAKRRKRSGRSPSIDALIQALIQGQVGQQLLT